MPRACVVLLLLSPLLAAPASAQVYRWVDADGRVHISDELPPGVAGERVELPADTPTGAAPVSPAAPRAPATRSAPASTPAASSGVGNARCLAARMDLAVLGIDRPVYREEDGRLGVLWAVGSRPNYYEGERRYLEDDEREELLAAARAGIARDCADADDAAAQSAAEDAWFHAEDCRAMRFDLEELRRPERRTAESDLERKQRETDAFCAAAP